MGGQVPSGFPLQHLSMKGKYLYPLQEIYCGKFSFPDLSLSMTGLVYAEVSFGSIENSLLPDCPETQ